MARIEEEEILSRMLYSVQQSTWDADKEGWAEH